MGSPTKDYVQILRNSNVYLSMSECLVQGLNAAHACASSKCQARLDGTSLPVMRTIV